MDKFKAKHILLMVFVLTAVPVAFAQEKELQEVNQIREDIQIINLLNSLSLRKEQMEFILTKALQAKEIQDQALKKVASLKSEMLKTYGAIKEEVSAGRVTVEKEDAKNFHKVKEITEGAVKEAQSEIEVIAQEVEGELEEFQLIALDGYKPCVIPIMNNGRIGQSEAATGVVKVLERVKTAPEQIYLEKKEEFLSRLLERIKAKLPPGVSIDEGNVKAEILGAFEAIRSMEEVDFQVKKAQIADELRGKVLPEKFTLNRKDKIKKFLLSKNIVPILEERLVKSQ